MSKQRSLRADEHEWELWQEAADRRGLQLTEWMRQALTRVADLEAALDRLHKKEEPTGW